MDKVPSFDVGDAARPSSSPLDRSLAGPMRSFKYLFAVGAMVFLCGTAVAADSEICSERLPFRSFVLRHIDMTADSEDLDQILTSARTNCPTGSKRLCKAIAQRADAALAAE